MTVMVAILAVVLFSVAALSVDLGNAWARKARVQAQVDAVALAGGGALPVALGEVSDARGVVAAFFNREANVVQGQPGSVTAAQLGDNDTANGEVTFGTQVTMPDGSQVFTTMRVVAPTARVDYGFATIMGQDHGDVQAEATVELRTKLPPVDDVLPMWLPAGCAYGTVAGDAGPSAPPPDASPVWTTTAPDGPHRTGPLDPLASVYGAPSISVEVPITDIPADRTWAVVRFTFGDGKWRDYLATWDTPTSGAASSRTVTVTVDPDATTRVNPVTSTSGTWQVWAMLPDDSRPAPADISGAGSMLYPSTHATFQVNGGGTVACAEHQRGNFGQMESPRVGVNQKQLRYAANVRFGLDHRLKVFPNAPSPECTGDDSPAGARIDSVSRDGNNCLFVDPGNDPNGLTNGLLAGVPGITAPSGRPEDNPAKGRLAAVTTSQPECGRSPGTVGGYVVNNDTLSCYLRPGYSLADIARSDSVPPDALDPAVLDSPRFFYAPVVYAGDRKLKKYLAIKEFVPVFLTDETEISTKSHSNASPGNGIVTNGGGKVQSVQLFAFNVEALPKPPNGDTVTYVPGTQGVPQLVG